MAQILLMAKSSHQRICTIMTRITEGDNVADFDDCTAGQGHAWSDVTAKCCLHCPRAGLMGHADSPWGCPTTAWIFSEGTLAVKSDL